MAAFKEEKVIVRLRVLRGVNLAAQDFYGGLKAPSSDPYGVVIVEGKEIGQTSTRTGTLDPVWADAASSFRFETTHSARVRVCLRDWDVTQEDDPMGEVSFVVGDVEKERRAKRVYSPNVWFNVVPTGDSPNSGKVLLGIMLEDACPPEHDDVDAESSKILRGPNVGRGLTPGTARTPVYLHIYDVGHSSYIRTINRTTEWTVGGGVFHAAIQVFGKEYSFGGTKANQTGIFACNPTKCPMHTYRQTIFLGDCYLPRGCVKAILNDMLPKWMGPTYNVLKKNCCDFSNAFAIDLGVGQIPNWTCRLAHCGAMLHDTINGAGTVCAADVDDEDSLLKNDLSSLLLEHVMAVRMQTAFRARKAREKGAQLQQQA